MVKLKEKGRLSRVEEFAAEADNPDHKALALSFIAKVKKDGVDLGDGIWEHEVPYFVTTSYGRWWTLGMSAAKLPRVPRSLEAVSRHAG